MFGKVLTICIVVLLAAVGVRNVWQAEPVDEAVVEQARQKLQAVPLDFGPWHGRERAVDPRVIRAAEALAYSNREYVHEKTGRTWNVLLLFGNTGAQAAHDPEVCYRGNGYRRLDTPVHYRLNPEQTGGPVDLWVARFEQSGTSPASTLQVFWGWGHDGVWEAVDNPRFAFASKKMIYKIYAQSGYIDMKDGKDKKEAKPGKEIKNRDVSLDADQSRIAKDRGDGPGINGSKEGESSDSPSTFFVPFYREVNRVLNAAQP